MRLLRLPLSMWYYGAVGAVLIIWSGAKLIVLPGRRPAAAVADDPSR